MRFDFLVVFFLFFQNGKLHRAGLTQCVVEYDGPMGNVGDVFWLCEEHATMMDEQNQNKAANLGREIKELYQSFWDDDDLWFARCNTKSFSAQSVYFVFLFH